MSRFLPYIHNLRGLAILFIVGVHVRGYAWDWKPGDMSYEFFVALFDNGTVLFVFIAGFLFQYLTHQKFQFIPYLWQKTKVVILPYLIVSLPILLFRLWYGSKGLLLEKGFDEKPLLYKLSFYLTTGMHMAPFWFIPMIFLVYLTAPILHRLDNIKFYRYGFPLVLLIGMFTFRPLNNANPLLSYLHFLPIYITGMWTCFNRHWLLKRSNWLLLPLFFIYLAITVGELADVITLNKRMNFEQVLHDRAILFNIYVFKALILCFILLMIFQIAGNRRFALFDTLGNYSFGIYFVHYYFISVFREAIEQITGADLAFNTPLFLGYYIAVVACSLVTVHITKRIFKDNSRYLIGS